ncbi:MAG: hypothetical protein Q8P66_01195 [Candidatus Colwellbacteria bacterium]|nr:hypothetical protein [Candidatus Colwellbacteria bacterium]
MAPSLHHLQHLEVGEVEAVEAVEVTPNALTVKIMMATAKLMGLTRVALIPAVIANPATIMNLICPGFR